MSRRALYDGVESVEDIGDHFVLVERDDDRDWRELTRVTPLTMLTTTTKKNIIKNILGMWDERTNHAIYIMYS